MEATLHKPSSREMLKYNDFALSVAAVEKLVNIVIDPADLQLLKDHNYKMCFAKKVGNFSYNVVWQAYELFLEDNEFTWTPIYQLFGTNTFKSDVTVKAATNPVSIGLGEITTLNSAGILSKPVSGGPETSLNLINDYGKIHAGVNQLSTGIDGSTVSTPIYVSEKAIIMGETELTPVEKVLVWFEQNIETSTMFSSTRSNAVEIDLTFTNSAARLYKGQKWSSI